ncbi:anti-sigma factor [Streptomyces sp. NPDC096934]|uniref:anti-sigma factor n=1 Tax=Streptomyces sp. NPDC096934 TaxID=3155551 RepID=UPI0033322159
MGEDPPPTVDEHLRTCPQCTRDLEALRHVVATVRAPNPLGRDLLAPPVGLWDSIASELAIQAPPRSTDTSSTSAGPTARPDQATGRTGIDDTDGGPTPSIVRSRGSKPGRLGRSAVMLAACAALLGAAAGSGVTWWATRDSSSTARGSDDGRRLDSLRASSAGYARVDGSGGGRTLDITVKGLPSTSGYFEVWLMDRTHSKLVSMGVLGPDGHATLPVPQNIDLGEYSVVDVSVQRFNGSSDHSGDSLVRGPFSG